MPAISNLVLTDRAGTPVDHTFVPDGIPNGIATWVESSGVKVGDKMVTLGQRKSASRNRVSLKIAIPVVATETINGVDNPKVVRTAYANVDFNFDRTSSRQERADLVGQLYEALSSSTTQLDKAIVDLESIY